MGVSKYLYLHLLICLSCNLGLASYRAVPDWSEGVAVPDGGRGNPYFLDPPIFTQYQTQGLRHSLVYPVDVTGILIPFEPVKKLIAKKETSVWGRIVNRIFPFFKNIHSFNDWLRWAGMQDYPESEGEGPYHVPFPHGASIPPEEPMGASLIETPHGVGFTISCAICHSGNLFGKKVIGMSARFPRGNEFFQQGLEGLSKVRPRLFRWMSGATPGEMQLFESTRQSAPFIGTRKPQALGLDTSLAQVALSLARRALDDVASLDLYFANNPREEWLANFAADSKPAVWWNLKYKNRWLSDGSVVSGNPIFTNFLWNEIGRGTNLKKLETWLDENEQTIQELTTAAFATQAPIITDFFPANYFDLEKAMRGEIVYRENACQSCHGSHIKNWSVKDLQTTPSKELLKTFKVDYPSQTPVVNVGTDPQRFLGMQSLVQLNDLKISREHDTVIRIQSGYVPPPLVGIWARWPYLHNNSVPSLCALFLPASRRPTSYWAGEAIDARRDFDFACNGYPSEPPEEWLQEPERQYDSTKQGLSNQGHDFGFGLWTEQERSDLIHFLQTL